MAVFDFSYVSEHQLSMYNTRARGFGSGPGGWARVPVCACGWNQTHSKKFGPKLSPRGSIFSDHYPNEFEAERAWREEHMLDSPEDRGRLVLLSNP